MRNLKNTCKIAVIQATPVIFDKEKGLAKALGLIDECAETLALLFPIPNAIEFLPPAWFIILRPIYWPSAIKITSGRIPVSRKLASGDIC